MRGIYQRLRTGATVILLASLATADQANADGSPPTLLWTQPSGLAVGDRFMALGYGRGVEFWDWEPDFLPHLRERLPGAAVSALWGSDSTLYWCSVDSMLHTAVLSESTWTTSTARSLDGRCDVLTGSNEFIAAVIGTSHLLFAARSSASDSLLSWQPPGAFPVAYAAIRDSTAAVVGADHAYLVRLRASGAALLDSLSLGDFAQAVEWAGDSLYLAFGFSGVKLATTQGDQFTGSLSSWSGAGSFGRWAMTTSACVAVDIFGGLEIFDRGQPFTPFTHLSYGGTPRAAIGRQHEAVLLTIERGLLLLNLFTLSSPFWEYQAPVPGFVRDLDHGTSTTFALADFSGVYELGPDEALKAAHPYNAQSLDVAGMNVAATSLLGGVALADLGSDSTQPYAVIPTVGSGRRAVIMQDRLFVAGDGACDTGVVVYQLAPPQAPVEVYRMAVCGLMTAMAAGPQVVSIARRDSGVIILDALTAAPGVMFQLPTLEVFDELAWQQSDLWGRNRTSELVRWHWNGVQLEELDRYHLPGLRAFDVSTDWLITSDSSRHARAWRWSPGSLQQIDSFTTRNAATSVAVLADTAWAVDGDAIVRMELEHTASINEYPVLPNVALLDMPYPNPFNGAVNVTLNLNRGPWSVRMVDVLGRTIQRWNGVAKTAGKQRLTWDPGRFGGAASGVYLIQAENAGLWQSRKVVYLK